MNDARPERTLASAAQIRRRVSDLARQISADYSGRTIDVVCLINGGSVFCADLVRRLTIPARLHWLGFSSYPQGNDTGEIRVTLDVNEPLHGRHVLVVEGIIVSGRTPRFVMDMLNLRQPASLEMCALGTKPAQLSVDLSVKYCAFEFGGEIVVGYGVGSGVEKTNAVLVESGR